LPLAEPLPIELRIEDKPTTIQPVESPKRQLHRNGLLWAGIASLTLLSIVAIIALLGPAPGASTADNADCSLSNPDGILSTVHIDHASFDQLEVKLGDSRAFPPATKCLVYGLKYSGSGTDYTLQERRLVATHFYPEPSGYLILLVFVLSPVLFVLLFRAIRGLRRQAQ
jgi:hypothetical protein